MAERIRLSRRKGWRKPEGAVVVRRPTLWGNPFIVGKHGTAAECVARYGLLALGYIDLGTRHVTVEDQELRARFIAANIETLRGKTLACACAPDRPCHADALITLANEGREALRRSVAHMPCPVAILVPLSGLDALRETAARRDRGTG